MMQIALLENSLNENDVGGKAAGLSKLISYGMEVPPGFVINKKAFHDYAAIKKFPTSFCSELERQLSDLKSDAVIVRSSAIGEDSEDHSFAGQLDSFVVDNNFLEVQDAIFKCWSGLENERVKAYQEFSGMKLNDMGVVIQEFVEADYAGVLFTRSPMDENTLYAEYVKGAGEQLVSGKVTPESFTFQNGVYSKKGLPFNYSNLVKESLKLKDKMGYHLDIEWVAKKDKIYLVQARPITVKNHNKVHWTNTNLNENYPDPISPLLYSIARDSYYHYFKNLAKLLQINEEAVTVLEYEFSNTVGIWSNRIYYNMTSIHNILSASPVKDYFKEAFNQFVGYNVKDVANTSTSKRTSLFRLARRLVGLNINLEKHVKIIENKVSAFSKRVDKSSEYESWCELFYEFLDLRFNQWYHASIADFFSMIHYKLLGVITEKTYGKKGVGIRNTLVQAIPGLISSEPLNETWDLVKHIDSIKGGRRFFLDNDAKEIYQQIQKQEEWQSTSIRIKEYLSKWGFRCSGELMFLKENYIEKPESFIELLQSYMRNNTQDPREIILAKDKDRRHAMRKFSKKIFRKRSILFPWSLFEVGQLYLVASLCKKAISSRERVRYKQAEMYYKFKVVIKNIGRQAVESGLLTEEIDIFYLSYKEIGELISTSHMFPAEMKTLVTKRKAVFEKESEKSFPHSFATDFGYRPESVQPEIDLVEGAKEFYGLAASGGRIKARIKVLESVLEGSKLEKGDILVTRQTDPGWAMVFPIIGGLIVERGGALSHGAIVAREFGIPAVIGIENITRILKDNDEVIVDGDLGKIQIL